MLRDIRLRVSLTHNGQMHVSAAATDNGHLTDDKVAAAQPRADYCHLCRGRPNYRRLAIRSPVSPSSNVAAPKNDPSIDEQRKRFCNTSVVGTLSQSE